MTANRKQHSRWQLFCVNIYQHIHLILLSIVIGLIVYALTARPPPSSTTPSEALPTNPSEARVRLNTPIEHSLAAEMAIDRQRPSIARDYYLKLANQSGDVTAAKRGVYLAIALGTPEKAVKSAEIWASKEPASLEAQQINTYLLFLTRQPVKASDYLQKSVQGAQNPGDLNRLILSLSHLPPQAKQPILQQLDSLARPFAQQPMSLYNIAQIQQALGAKKEAIALLDKVLVQKPDWFHAISLKAQLLALIDGMPALVSFLSPYLEKPPNEKRIRLLLAEILIDHEQVGAAKQVLQPLMANAKQLPPPLLAPYLLNMAYISFAEGNMPQTKAYLLQASQFKETREAAFYALGEVALFNQDYPQALRWFEQITSGPQYLKSQLKIALLYAREGQINQARRHLQQLEVQHYGELRTIYLTEAEILITNRRYQEAYQSLQQALQVLPDNLELLYVHALVAQQLEHYAVMEKNLKKILSKQPNNAKILNILGYVLADKTQRYQEAQQYIEKALALEPNNPAILDSLGWLQYRMGKFDQAHHYLSMAYEQTGPDTEISAHLGAVLWTQGDQEKAEQIWQEALTAFPSNEYLLKVMKETKQPVEATTP